MLLARRDSLRFLMLDGAEGTTAMPGGGITYPTFANDFSAVVNNGAATPESSSFWSQLLLAAPKIISAVGTTIGVPQNTGVNPIVVRPNGTTSTTTTTTNSTLSNPPDWLIWVLLAVLGIVVIEEIKK